VAAKLAQPAQVVITPPAASGVPQPLPVAAVNSLANSRAAAGATGLAVSSPAMAPVPAAPVATAQPAPRAATPVKAPPAEPDLGPEPPPWDDVPSSSADHDASADAMLAAWDDAPRTQRMPAQEPPRQAARPSSPPSAEPSAVEAPPPATVVPHVPRTELGDRWTDVVKQLVDRGLVAALVRELALQAECVAVDDSPGKSVWRLRVERENLRSAAQQEKLTQALVKLLGGDVALELEAGIGKDTPALRDQAERAGRQAAAEVLIRQDPLVVGLLQHFPGSRIVAGSISPL